jgi:hypothetical protein
MNELLTKIIVGSVTQEDFLEYTGLAKEISDFLSDNKHILKAFGFHVTWGTPKASVICIVYHNKKPIYKIHRRLEAHHPPEYYVKLA